MDFSDFNIGCVGGFLFGYPISSCGYPANQLGALLTSDLIVFSAGVLIGVPLAAWLVRRFVDLFSPGW